MLTSHLDPPALCVTLCTLHPYVGKSALAGTSFSHSVTQKENSLPHTESMSDGLL